MEDIVQQIIPAVIAAVVTGLVIGWGFLKATAAKSSNKIDDAVVAAVEEAMKRITNKDA